MADTTELKAARWAATLPIAGGPKSNDLEAVVKLILGTPLATVITRGLGLNEVGQFATEEIWIRGSVAGTVGLRIQDTGASGEDFLVMADTTHLYIYVNTGTEGTPTWTHRGFVPISLICRVYRNTAMIVDTTLTAITWEGVKLEEESTMWAAGAPTRLVAPVTGWYRLDASAYEDAGAEILDSLVHMQIKENGSSTKYASSATQYVDHSAAEPGCSINTWWEGQLTAADYLEVLMYTNNVSDIAMASFRANLELKRLL